MPSGFDVRGLSVPVIVAPMAGGPSTPELAAAGTNAGGLGFVAAGYLTADALAERVIAARKLTTGPLGVNLFTPQLSAATPDGIAKYAAALMSDAKRYGAELGDPAYNDDAWWASSARRASASDISAAADVLRDPIRGRGAELRGEQIDSKRAGGQLARGDDAFRMRRRSDSLRRRNQPARVPGTRGRRAQGMERDRPAIRGDDHRNRKPSHVNAARHHRRPIASMVLRIT